MKIKTTYHCDYCKFSTEREATMINHEKMCTTRKMIESKSCEVCKHHYIHKVVDDEPWRCEFLSYTAFSIDRCAFNNDPLDTIEDSFYKYSNTHIGTRYIYKDDFGTCPNWEQK